MVDKPRERGGSQGWGVGGQQAMERTMYEVRPEKRARLTLLDDGDRSDAIDEVDFFVSSIFLDPYTTTCRRATMYLQRQLDGFVDVFARLIVVVHQGCRYQLQKVRQEKEDSW